ncbi:hypothetical protein H2200_011929 [Cladophialophora chaetospira]|uniref:Uncharacterized protein n=1 Tax=Cladophialophora chaetospira TaxID=386627 RepID=A0AA39CCZ1_9EURO|nr:hypothetical protein H2200_011929 [Cladophialophora chaetospira]
MDNKKGPTATVEPMEASPAAVEEAVFKTERRLNQAVWTIVGGVALPCIPIIVITVILLYFIFHHQVHLSQGYEELQPLSSEAHQNVTDWISLIRHQGGSAAYYVKFNPSTITTIASWTSRIIPYLSSSVMALVGFFAARHLVLCSKHGDEHGSSLPTPEQLTLLISVLGGSGFGPLRDTILHRYKRKEKLIAPLPAAFSALFIITFLGLIIPFIDSWFGIATKAEVVTQLVEKPNNTSSYGRGLSSSRWPNGPRDNGTSNNYNPTDAWWPSDLYNINGHGAIVTGLIDAQRIIYGTSNTTQIMNYTDAAGVEHLYLADPKQSALEDFRTSTIAISAQCVPMTQLCYFNFDAAQQGHLFNCTHAFSGDLRSAGLNPAASPNDSLDSAPSNVGLAFAANPQLTEAGGEIWMSHIASSYGIPDDLTDGFTYPEIYPTNPLHYGAWATGFPAGDASGFTTFTGDTGIYYDTSLGGIWVFNCSMTVWEVNYTWVNGAVQKFNTTLASKDLSAMLSAPLAWSPYTYGISNSIISAASRAAYTGDNSRKIARTFAREISRAMLALSAFAMDPVPNDLEQDRIAGLSLARIPLVPLYLLIATKAIYVIAVIVLAIGAYCFTHPAETEVVKAQLSVKGLAAAHFNQPGLLQQNVVKQIQDRLDAANSNDKEKSESEPKEEDISFESKGLRHAATAPVQGSAVPPPANAKVGMLPTADGGWEFVLLANGVWNSIKPIVKNLVIQDANTGGMGDVGQVIKAWH